MKTRLCRLTVVPAFSAFALLATPVETSGKWHHHRGWNSCGYSSYNRGCSNCGYGYSQRYYQPGLLLSRSLLPARLLCSGSRVGVWIRIPLIAGIARSSLLNKAGRPLELVDPNPKCLENDRLLLGQGSFKRAGTPRALGEKAIWRIRPCHPASD